MDLMGILSWIGFGLVVGLVARFLLPGRQSMGWIMTILLGVAGSFAGGAILTLIAGGEVEWARPAGWVMSIVGALVVLIAYSLIIGRR